ncbi:hypothetical protein DPMN_088182 [Dreissena polymorpha]|uniref:Uncharacterized protein n=1 Tax=Dreissena polymorpha TaxID=45954 RepID=A0A9D4KVE9_DREPO|nr:hypothetical protein DPMN_088182 [Dreissena polymorpha]
MDQSGYIGKFRQQKKRWYGKAPGLEEFFQSHSPCRASRSDNPLTLHFNLLVLH